MRNNHLKNRFENLRLQKSHHLKVILGDYVCKIQSIPPVIGLDDWVLQKPKSFTFYNWVYPYLVFNKIPDLEKTYQKCKEWSTNSYKEIVVKVSGKLQHLCQCLDSPHFKACSSSIGLRKEIADNKLKNPYLFCVFIKDSAGHVIARYLGKIGLNHLFKYKFYGNVLYKSSLDDIFEKLSIKLNKPIKIKSFC